MDDERGEDVPTALQRVWFGEDDQDNDPHDEVLRYADLLRVHASRSAT
jgi:hypothetical protein